MAHLGMNMLYALRVNLSVAIVSMVRSQPTIAVNSTTSLDSLPDNPIAQQFDWNEKQQGLILGSFFWGYVVTQLPGGRMADMFGSKIVFLMGILIPSVLTIISPLAAKQHYVLFIVLRVLQGLFEVIRFSR